MTSNQPNGDAYLQTQIDRYIALASKHGHATEIGDPDMANAAYRELNYLFSEIVDLGNREILVPLLAHENPSVRAKAAIHTYVLNPQRSESVLEEVAAFKSLVGFSAEMTLKQLRNGSLSPK